MRQSHDSKYVPALGFRWLTPCYDAVVGATTRERRFKHALIRQAKIEAGQRVLDLACGTGILAIWRKQACPGAEVVGVNGDSAVLTRAARKAQRAAVALQLDEALAYALPYPSACFDRVLSSLFFHHLSWADKQRTAQEAFRVLRPGGQLHVADWGKAGNGAMRGLFLALQLLDGWSNTWDNVAGQLIKLFENAGFVEVSQRQTFSTLFGTMTLYSARKPD